ncbi:MULTISPECIES: hypothetical protein [unclassified Fibrobacter]|uniref:hypothetical protein n=1 Tax=unclassified Fibrobacter TaxID=2634177 RepID=UPI0011B24CC8|nr:MULTISPECIES: hypothetical protein [unclassified Fibrobacter]
MEEESLTCKADPLWGEKLLNLVIDGGNFGRAADHGEESTLKRWTRERKSSAKYKSFDLVEYFWLEISYWHAFCCFMPQRIKRRKISIRK